MVRISLRVALLCLLVPLAAGQARSETPPPEPDGYRISDYRAKVPATFNGHAALTSTEAVELWREGTAVFIDTLPQPPRPAGLPAGTIWQPRPRLDIPRSIWLPDTGYGQLPVAMESYFKLALITATQGDRGRHLVFYCLADCWMSWNAAKRASDLGYASVDWYAAGTDGWLEAGLPLELREPVPRPPQ